MHLIIFSALGTFFLLLLILPLLKKFFLDYPVKRSSHIIPTPKGGGIVFAIISVIGSFIYKTELVFSCIPLAIVGFLDDRYNLPRRIRFFAQFITAISFLHQTQSVFYLKFLNLIEINYFLEILLPIFMVFSIIAFINFTNFLDGLDGLLCGCMIIAMSVEAYLITPYLWILVGSLIAFLFFNWSPAKLFMGDSGSTFLGALYIGFALKATSLEQFFGLILVTTPIIADASTCVLKRLFLNQPIFTPHKLHLFQRLNQAGLSHSLVATIYILCTGLIASALIFINFNFAFISAIIVLIFGIYLDRFVAVKFNI